MHKNLIMDCLDKLIQLAQVSGEVNIRCLFQGQWQIQPNITENQYVGAFHLIEQGECWLTLGERQIHLQAGDIFFSSAKSTALNRRAGSKFAGK